jgi:hypothetical protein
MWGYSGGAWCQGHADNNDFWALISLSKDSLLSSLLPSGGYSNDATIGDALHCKCSCKDGDHDKSPELSPFRIKKPNPKKDGDTDGDSCNYDYHNLNKPKNEQGLWKQRAVAALNLKLWEIMTEDYDTQSGCLPFNYAKVHNDFYFLTTLSIIMTASVQDLDLANRDGFPDGDFQDTCS